MKPTATQIATRVETDLSGDDLQALIDAADEDVTRRFGPHSGQIDDLSGGGVELWLTRPADSVNSIVETVDDTDTTLVAADYAIKRNGWALKRLTTGTNSRTTWGERVKVHYEPESDNRRFDVIVDLVKLSLSYTAAKSEKAGDYSTTVDDYDKERLKILRRLSNGERVFA